MSDIHRTLNDSTRAHSGQWQSATDPNDMSGVATFSLDGMAVSYEIPLESFADFQRVHYLLEIAFAQGKRRATREMRTTVVRALDVAASGG